MSIDYKWFEDFLSLARNNNFSRASEERHVTQSAFSRRIQALELWVGIPLVDRSTYPTQLTPAGQIFIKKAQEVVLLVSDIKSEFDELKIRDQNMIQFTSLHSTALSFFPKWLTEIESELGPIYSKLGADSMHNCVQNMTEGGYDFLISLTHSSVSVVLDPYVYPSLVIGSDRLIPVSVADNKGQPKHTLPGTRQQPTSHLSYPANSYFGRLVDTLIKRKCASCYLEESYENSFADAIRYMALEGRGLAWLPESMVKDDLANGRFVKVEGDHWVIDLDTRIYRHIVTRRPQVEQLWAFLLKKYQ